MKVLFTSVFLFAIFGTWVARFGCQAVYDSQKFANKLAAFRCKHWRKCINLNAWRKCPGVNALA